MEDVNFAVFWIAVNSPTCMLNYFADRKHSASWDFKLSHFVLFQFISTSEIMIPCRHLAGLIRRGINWTQGICIHRATERRKNAGKHPSLKWDSNLRSQCSIVVKDSRFSALLNCDQRVESFEKCLIHRFKARIFIAAFTEFRLCFYLRSCILWSE